MGMGATPTLYILLKILLIFTVDSSWIILWLWSLILKKLKLGYSEAFPFFFFFLAFFTLLFHLQKDCFGKAIISVVIS